MSDKIIQSNDDNNLRNRQEFKIDSFTSVKKQIEKQNVFLVQSSLIIDIICLSFIYDLVCNMIPQASSMKYCHEIM